MRTLTLVVVALLAGGAPRAAAGGFNITWGSGCWQDEPATLKTFACDGDAGSAAFTVSFVVDRDLEHFVAQIQADLQSDSPDLPDWWQFADPGGCRVGALTTSADFTSAPGGCSDPWRGLAHTLTRWRTGLLPGDPPWPDARPDRAQLICFAYVDGIAPLARGIEYYAVTATVEYRRSTGTGACRGCGTPATLVLNEVRIADVISITNPLANACLRWQAGGATPCSATPARNSTWGLVKSLYR